MTYYAPPEGSYEDSHGYGLMSGVLNLGREQAAAAVGVRAGHQQDDLALRADRERMDRVRDAGAHEHRNTLALEETLHDERLAPIAAVDLHERGAVAAIGRTSREGDDLAHAVMIITQVCGNPFRRSPFRAGVQSPHQTGGGSWTSTNTSGASLRSASSPARRTPARCCATSTSRSTAAADFPARSPTPTTSILRPTGCPARRACSTASPRPGSRRCGRSAGLIFC